MQLSRSPLLMGLTLLSGLSLAAAARPLPALSFQQGAEVSAPSVSPAVPARSVAGPLSGELPQPEADVLRDAVVQGPYRELPVLQVDDEVPAAGEDLVIAGDQGDELIQRADGDPYFIGFAAGNYYPPAGELVDPELRALANSATLDGRPSADLYAFVMFSKRITPERSAALEALGVRTLGRHPHHSLKVALPGARLDEVAGLPFVRWVGVAERWQKVHPALSAQIAAGSGESREVWISVFESDVNAGSTVAVTAQFEQYDPNGPVVAPTPFAAPAEGRTNGWQERALRDLGIETSEYLESARSFRARISPSRVDELAALDFVQFLSPHVEGGALHDESMPLLNADYSRSTYDGSFDSAVVVGVVDSGITINHTGFAPIWAAGWDFTGEAAGAWVDGRQHGSHVSGTILGRGTIEDSYAGAAPGVGSFGGAGRLFNYKIIDTNNSTAGVNWNTLYNYLHSGWTDGNGLTTPRAHILNHSWGSSATNGGWVGTEPQAVAFDSEVYDYNQLQVFAAGNSGPGASSVTLQASAKNVLSVGGIIDYNSQSQGLPGSSWSGSSRGPVADGRWKPNVVAPAQTVRSIKALTNDEYVNGQGTSMAAPHVSGLAAQLLDHYAFLRYKPATTAALLMATAMTKDNDSISVQTDAHLDQYGAGRVDGARAHWSTSQQVPYIYGWPSADGNSTIDVDIVVNPGATRMTVVMVYFEPAASVGANKAVVNDWDMWIDAAPFSGAGNAGEYSAHQSSYNNVELRSIENPAANTYRIKLYPDNVSDTCRVGLSVSVIYGDTTPDGSLTLEATDIYVKPNEDVVFTGTAYNPEFTASAVFLNATATGGPTLVDSTAVLRDGATASFLNNSHSGYDVLLGNIRHGTSRAVDWTVHWATEGVKTWSVDADSDNWLDKSAQVQVIVDGTEPGLVNNLQSTSHTPGVWSKDPSIDYSWTLASDNLSGVDGYGVFTSNSPNGAPGATKDIENVSTYSEVLTTDALPYYFKIRTVDNSGNWTAGYATTGGYLIDTITPTAASNLASSTHQVGVTSCNTTVTMNWTAGSDQHSGVDGYLAVWNHVPNSILQAGTNLPANATSYQQALANGDDWYFHLRVRDAAGNFGLTVHAGPFSVSDSPWSTYCTSKVSSNLCIPIMKASGNPSLGNPAGFTLGTVQMETNKSAVTFFGLTGPNNAPFQGGFLCVNAPVYRLPLRNTGGVGNCNGGISYTLAELLAHPAGGALIVPGSTIHAQTWFRDPPAATGTGLSNGLTTLVCP